jgi:DNA gyrase subunit A
MTSQGKTLRFKASEIKEQGQGASWIKVVKISEPDYLVGIDKIGDKSENEEN